MGGKDKILVNIAEELGINRDILWPRLEIIGDIAVFRKPFYLPLSKELLDMYRRIASELINRIKNIKSVWLAYTPVSDLSKTRKYILLAGRNVSETVYREHGCSFKLDIRKVYFSPRLNYEHGWFSKFVKPGERILNMFAGIGFFSILPACRKEAKSYAIDVNSHAYKYLLENIRLNKVEGKVYAFHGDAAIITSILISEKKRFEHVIMPYPERSLSYLPVAVKAVNKCGYLHIYLHYRIERQTSSWAVKEYIQRKLLRLGVKDVEILRTRLVRTVGPRYGQYVVTVKTC
jgi:tRNA (guanine37-N1)-methyltransferase